MPRCGEDWRIEGGYFLYNKFHASSEPQSSICQSIKNFREKYISTADCKSRAYSTDDIDKNISPDF